MNPIKAFLSYSHEDGVIKDQVYSDLSAAGIDLWIDHLKIPVGKQWDRAIEEAIDGCEKFIVLLSQNSTASDIVLDEVNYALEQKKSVIPVKVDECRIPLRLRRIEMLDMQTNYRGAVSQLCQLVLESSNTGIESLDDYKPSFAYHPGQRHLPSLAVLPFASSTNEEQSNLFSDGLLNGIVSELSHNPLLFVIASATSRTYSDENIDIKAVARELRVQYLVIGRLTLIDKRIRLYCELINARNDQVIWSDKFDKDVVDLFTVQDLIVRSVVHQLSRGVSRLEYNRVMSMNPNQLSAWELYQRAMHYGWSYDWLVDSIKLLEHAIELDPAFAEAHALLAARLAYMMWFGEMEMVARSMNYARTALELEPDNSLCLLSASVVFNAIGQPATALEQVEKSIEINPNLADSWAHNGLYLAVMGRNKEALDMLEYAFELSPKDPVRYLWYAHKAICFTNMEKYELALEACKSSTALHSGWFWSFMALAQSHAMLDQKEEARSAWNGARKLNPTVSLENHKMWLKSSSLSDEHRERIYQSLKRAGCE